MDDSYGISRRRVVAGALGAGLVATAGLRFAGAQEDDATPDATDEATPAVGVGGVQGEDEAAEVTDAIARADAAIAAAQADRDAVAGQIDTQTIDQLLGQATTLRDRAQTASDGGDAVQAWRLARAAAATADAAGELVAAQLITAGLPSQQAPASRILAEAFDAIDEVGQETADAGDADVDFYVTTAQSLYQSAFDLYGGGAYGQAARTARVAARLAGIGAFLAAPADEVDFGDERGRGRRGGGRDGGPGFGGDHDEDEGQDEDQEAPVEVPEPTF
jgi:hypothetical protein